jgi:protein-S-isoprenylcysteine O-methyltransferase Ste14
LSNANDLSSSRAALPPLRVMNAHLQSGVDLFRWLELAALGLFLGLSSYRTVRLRLRYGVNGIACGRQNRLAIGAFAVTWLWALLVLWYALPVGGHALLPPLDLPSWRWLPLRLIGVGMITAGAALNLLAHIQLGDNWRLGIGQDVDGHLVTTGVYARSRHPISCSLTSTLQARCWSKAGRCCCLSGWPSGSCFTWKRCARSACSKPGSATRGADTEGACAATGAQAGG